MLGRRSERLDADDTLQDGGGLRVFGGGRDDTGTVDEVYAFGKRDILPNL